MTEYHGGPKCLTRAGLRYRFVPTTILINLVTLCLLSYHQLHAGHVDIWMLALYGCFLLFLVNRARRLKFRVAEMVDLAAYRAGLQRIPRAAARAPIAADRVEATADAK